MTYHTALKLALSIDPTDSIRVEVFAWRHMTRPGEASYLLRWKIWSANLEQHFEAEEAADAINAYAHAALRRDHPEDLADVTRRADLVGETTTVTEELEH
jgi:hypothetical protein